jgi:hypothetical protein
MPSRVNKHRSWTPGLRKANLLIYFANSADNRGSDRRRPGPHPERISSRYIKALRSSEMGACFGAYSHSWVEFQADRGVKSPRPAGFHAAVFFGGIATK